MTKFTEDAKNLLESAKSYALDQKDKFLEEASTLYKKIGTKLEKLSADVKTELKHEYEILAKELEHLKNTADDKQKELRAALADKINKLSKKVDKDSTDS